MRVATVSSTAKHSASKKNIGRGEHKGYDVSHSCSQLLSTTWHMVKGMSIYGAIVRYRLRIKITQSYTICSLIVPRT